jgi:hypothetical protein
VDASGMMPGMAEPQTEDPRIAFVYQEALRGLVQQQAAVESLHNRAATLVFAASFAGSLLGSRALADGVGSSDWIAIVLLLLIGALTVVLLWPYYHLSFALVLLLGEIMARMFSIAT